VKRAAAERLANLIDPDRVLREICRIAYADTSKLFGENGELLPIKDWPADLRRSVAAVDVVKRNVTSGDGLLDEVLKVKLHDKIKALEMLAKHLQMFEERIKHSGGIEIKWQD
jgi:phage terminase small subunit